jgi:hypothetical protein
MKKILLTFILVTLLLPVTVIFAQDESTPTDSSSVNADTIAQTPSNAPRMPPNPALGGAQMAPPIMPGSRTVVATSDGGIVIVEGNKITKLDGDLNVTKSIDLKDTENK